MCQDICSKHVIITLTLEYQSDECCQQMKFNHKTDCSAHSQVLNLRATSSYEFIETLMPQEPCFHYLSGEFERHFKMFQKIIKKKRQRFLTPNNTRHKVVISTT